LQQASLLQHFELNSFSSSTAAAQIFFRAARMPGYILLTTALLMLNQVDK
jgi:hypothetical protein